MLKMFKAYNGLPKSIYILFIGQVINRFGDFVMPFLTLFLTVKLGLPLAASGLIVTICSLISMPASLLGGGIADKLGRKNTYIFAQFISAAALIPCAVIKNPYIIVICLMINAFFNGFTRPALNAIITDILPASKRQAGFSLQYLGINIGVSLGPIVAGFLFNNLLPLLFIGDAVTSFVTLFLIWMYIEETHPSHTKVKLDSKEEKAEKGNIFAALLKRPQLCFFLIIYIAFSFVYTQHRFSLPATMAHKFGVLGPTFYGYLMSVNAITVIIFTVPITAFMKNKQPVTNMIAAGIMYTIGFGMLGYISNLPLFVVSTVIWTIGEVLIMVSFGVYIANNSPSNYRASFSAVGSISWSIGGALCTSLSGKYMDVFGANSIWSLTMVVAIIATFLMVLLKSFSDKKQSLTEVKVQ